MEKGASAPAAPLRLGVVFEDGLFAGVIGALVVAVWFLILDAVHGRPLYTPTLLGMLVLHGPESLGAAMPVQASPVAVYTGLHFLAFVLVGTVASYLWALFARYPSAGIALLFAFILFETGFFALNFAMGSHVLGLLGAWTVGVGNLLAAGGMGAYLWVRHPHAVKRLASLWTEE